MRCHRSGRQTRRESAVDVCGVARGPREGALIEKETNVGKLDGRIALITGGTSGIGLATAKRFVNEGAYVYITGRCDSELTAAVKEVGHNVTGVRGDVSNLADLDLLFAQITRDKARLDANRSFTVTAVPC